jgi:hypothetical protein
MKKTSEITISIEKVQRPHLTLGKRLKRSSPPQEMNDNSANFMSRSPEKQRIITNVMRNIRSK